MPFSRKFLNTDNFKTLNNGDVYQATFITQKVLYFLTNTCMDATEVEIFSTSGANPTFGIRATKPDGSKGDLLADFPCPNQCVPPTSQKDLRGIQVKFNVSHFLHLLLMPNCVFLNVQLAVRNGPSTNNADSTSIYPLLVEQGVLDPKSDKTRDFFYISDPS